VCPLQSHIAGRRDNGARQSSSSAAARSKQVLLFGVDESVRQAFKLEGQINPEGDGAMRVIFAARLDMLLAASSHRRIFWPSSEVACR
jgi:hypothetical protein